MPYAAADARRQLLDDVAIATDRVGVALAALGEAYEGLDDDTAQRLEDGLFRPVQAAYGRARRTHTGFAERSGVRGRTFTPQAAGVRPGDARAPIEHAVEAVAEADHVLAELQDSMRPVEVGDRELRSGLAEVRQLLAEVPPAARELLRTFGR